MTPTHVYLETPAWRNLDRYCKPLGARRQTVLSWVSQNPLGLNTLSYSLSDIEATWRTRILVPADSLDILRKHIGPEQDYVLTSLALNQIFAKDLISPPVLGIPPAVVQSYLLDALVWFQFDKVLGVPQDLALALDDAWFHTLQPHEDGTLRCQGGFTHHEVRPFVFGFTGFFEAGNLHAEMVLPAF